MKRNSIKSASLPSNAILGTFEGECADANITNKNGLDITREVWENVFNSEEYKEAIKLGHFIGFLGHPDDPGCQDFEHACIVMTEGHIDDNGKVYGKFNLVDTPVGQIVKKFIDAGVTFGISVRGAGDIISNSVDPDTFVFRGFDLVTFPAYPESIPTFSEVAASSDAKAQQKYRAVCAAVSKNIKGLNTVESVNVIQSCFASQSEPYKQLEARKQQLQAAEDADADAESVEDIDMDELEAVNASKIKGLTQLYVAACKKIKALSAENARIKRLQHTTAVTSARKIRTIKRMMSAQLAEMDKSVSDIGRLHAQAVQATKQVKSEAITKLKATTVGKDQKIAELENVIASLKDSNLKYKQKVEANVANMESKDKIIADLKIQAQKTVRDLDSEKDQVSNLDMENENLRSEITATKALLKEYQQAYASLYSSATGVTLDKVAINATTSTSDIRRMVNRAAVTASTELETSYSPTDEFDLDDGDSDDSLVVI